jgi:hypothetical protein
MFVLVNYHMDTFFGIGQVREYNWVSTIHVCKGGYVQYTERGGGDIIWGIHVEYPYAGGNYDFR